MAQEAKRPVTILAILAAILLFTSVNISEKLLDQISEAAFKNDHIILKLANCDSHEFTIRRSGPENALFLEREMCIRESRR